MVKQNIKSIFKIIWETELCIHIFATDWFHIKKEQIMRRDIFQAIADPTRRAILTLIAVQAMTPNAIAEHFNTTRQAVSKHLKILTECQLLKQEQQLHLGIMPIR